MRLSFLCMQFLPGGSDDAALSAIDRWGSLFRAVSTGDGRNPLPGQFAIDTLSSYILRVTDLTFERVAAAVAEVAQPRDWSVIMGTYDRVLAEGRALGRKEGKKEGKAEGQAAICLRLLTARFGALPESIVARVRSAGEADFDRWALRLLDARSLAEVFANA